jgi:hypothetical protein
LEKVARKGSRRVRAKNERCRGKGKTGVEAQQDGRMRRTGGEGSWHGA